MQTFNYPDSRSGFFGWLIILACTVLVLTNCSQEEQFISRIEETSGKSAYRNLAVFTARITAEENGIQKFNGRIFIEIRGDHMRLEPENGGVLIFDGKTSFVSSQQTAVELLKTRFQVLNWPYLFKLPFQLRTAGKLNMLGTKAFLGNEYPAARLTAEAISPEHGHILYQNPQTGLLQSVVYRTESEDESIPGVRALVYTQHRQISGVEISTMWVFYPYNPDEGVVGRSYGRIKLSRLQFIKEQPEMFAVPKDYQQIALPRISN